MEKQTSKKATNKKTELKIEESKDPVFKQITKDKDKEKRQFTKEQQEIIDLKSQLMMEKIDKVGRKRENFITRKRKRKFSDTENDNNATTLSILKGAGLMAFGFGLLAIFILIFG